MLRVLGMGGGGGQRSPFLPPLHKSVKILKSILRSGTNQCLEAGLGSSSQPTLASSFKSLGEPGRVLKVQVQGHDGYRDPEASWLHGLRAHLFLNHSLLSGPKAFDP